MLRRALFIVLTVSLSLTAMASQAQIIDFETPATGKPPLSPDSYYNGADGTAGFEIDGAAFNNSFDTTYYTWGGWAYSNLTDSLSTVDLNEPDYTYEYSAVSGAGAGGSATYGLGYVDPYTPTTPKIVLPAGAHPVSLQINNTTYATLSMKDGDGYAKQFTGPTDSAPGDWFKLTITGLDSGDHPIGSVDFYLADFRSPDSLQHYVVTTWQNVNLFGLYDARALSFTLSSSDSGAYGMNTPAFFAADDLSLTKQIGDVTGDAIVNGLDISTIAGNWLHSGPQGDTNGDGVVNGLDISTIAANWLAGGGPVVVPEPAAGLLALAGLVSLCLVAKLRKWTATSKIR